MKHPSFPVVPAILSIALLALVSPKAKAQSGWPTLARGSYAEVEFGHAFLDVPQDSKAPFGSLVLAARFEASPTLRIVAEIPLSSGVEYSNAPPFEQSRNLGVGNAYAGVDINTSSPGSDAVWLTEVGVNLPLVGDDAEYLTGILYTQYVERFGAIWPRRMTISASEYASIPLADQISLLFRVGPSVYIPTEDGPDTEVFFNYGAKIRLHTAALGVNLGVAAFSIISEDADSFDDRTRQHLVLEADYATSTFIPFLGFRLPVGGRDDDYLDGGFVLSLGCRLPFGS